MSDSQKKRRESDDNDQPSSPAWMTTYGDMMTLLMTFFILIMSFSSIELDKFKAAMGSLKGAFGVLGDSDNLNPAQSYISHYQHNMQKVSLVEHVQNLRETVSKLELENDIEIYETDSEVTILITAQILFESGGANLKSDFLPTLSKIAKTVINKANEIRIAGHTDTIPINTKKYPSNWELSVDRALGVMRFLVNNENINSDKVSISGFAEYHPLVSNDSQRNRAINRRVEIYLKW